MITANWSRHLQQPDSLLAARDAIFEAMFERAAGLLELEVDSDSDHSFMDVYVADLNADLAVQFLDLLEQVDLLGRITVDVSSSEEQNALAAYTAKATIELVPSTP